MAETKVSPNEHKAITWTGNMSSVTPTSTSQSAASVTIPTLTAAHKYIVIGTFEFQNGGGTGREYFAEIVVGGSSLRRNYWNSVTGDYINTITLNMVYTSSATGGDIINFNVGQTTTGGSGSLTTRSEYSVVDLGVS